MKKETGLSKFIGRFKGRRILVIGDIILDRYIWGKVSRISPEAPVPVVDVQGDSFMLGGAANVANNIISLGGKATVFGIVGRDREADMLKVLLRDTGIESVLIEDARSTSVKTRVIAHSQQVVRFDTEKRHPLAGRALSRLIEKANGLIAAHDAIIVSDYKKGVVSAALMKNIIRHAKGKFIAVDPKVGHFHLYKGVSLITPNLAEAAQGSEVAITDEKTLLAAGRRLIERLGIGAVLITRGEEGMSLFDGRGVKHIPTISRKVFDVTGAGDTVISAFCLAHLAGASLRQAAALANHAAGIVVGQVGTATASPEDLRKSLRENGR